MTTPTIPNTPPGVVPVVEIGIGDRYDASSVAALWGTARWSTVGDDNEWGGTEPLWNDIACDTLDISTFTGRDGTIDPFEIGTATIVVTNRDGWADYKPPGANDNILTVRPGRQIRVGVVVGNDTGTPPAPPPTFPVISTYNTEIGTSLGAANPMPAPAGVVAGDLLIACCSFDSVTAETTSTGWTRLALIHVTSTFRATVFARIADGTATDILSLTGASSDYCVSMLRITGHAVTDVAADVKIASVEGAAAAAVDPPSLDAGSVRDWLWLAVVGADAGGTYSLAAPASYTLVHPSLHSSPGSSTSAALAVTQRDLNAQTENPGVLAVTGTAQKWVGFTVAIPAAAPTPAPPAGNPVWLWRGTIDTTEPGYIADVGDIVTLGCIDAKGDAGRADIAATLEPVAGGELAYQRFTRILDLIKWPRWRRTYDVDSVPLGPTEFGTSATSELDRTAESSSGHVYGDTTGKVVIRRKDWMVWAGTAPVDATIGNGATSDICPSEWELHFNREDLTTRTIVGRTGEEPIQVDNPEAVGLYGVETWERTDMLPTSNFELSRISSRVHHTRGPNRMPRIAAVVLHAATGAGEVAELLASASPFTPSRYRCRHYADDARLVFDRTMFVVGVRHTISPVDGWTARLALDDARPFRQVANPARWDDARWSTDDMWAHSL